MVVVVVVVFVVVVVLAGVGGRMGSGEWMFPALKERVAAAWIEKRERIAEWEGCLIWKI